MTICTSVFNQLLQLLDVKLEPPPDQLAIMFDVDFIIPICNQYIGLRFRFHSDDIQYSEVVELHNTQQESRNSFTEYFGGKVFDVYYYLEGNKKIVANPEVIAAISSEAGKLYKQ